MSGLEVNDVDDDYDDGLTVFRHWLELIQLNFFVFVFQILGSSEFHFQQILMGRCSNQIDSFDFCFSV